jgi:hypothetical protein
MPYTAMQTAARSLRSGDKVLRRLPYVSWVVFRIVSNGSYGDVVAIDTGNGAHYFAPDQVIGIRRDKDFCAHCSFGWSYGGTGRVQSGWCPKHPRQQDNPEATQTAAGNGEPIRETS